MIKKITEKTPRCSAQPEITPGDKWRDERGDIVTIDDIRFNRVTFFRDGFSSPCVQPESRFLNEFQPVCR